VLVAGRNIFLLPARWDYMDTFHLFRRPACLSVDIGLWFGISKSRYRNQVDVILISHKIDHWLIMQNRHSIQHTQIKLWLAFFHRVLYPLVQLNYNMECSLCMIQNCIQTEQQTLSLSRIHIPLKWWKLLSLKGSMKNKAFWAVISYLFTALITGHMIQWQ